MVDVSELLLAATVIVGARSPEALVIDVLPSDEVPDLTIVLSAELRVFRNHVATPETWTAQITHQAADRLELTHPYVAGNVDTVNDRLRIYVMLTASGWSAPRRAKMCALQVFAE